jgi:hypothetical protein
MHDARTHAHTHARAQRIEAAAARHGSSEREVGGAVRSGDRCALGWAQCCTVANRRQRDSPRVS